MFPKLFSVSATGAERYWVIKVVKNDDDSATIIREYGQVSGKAQFAETHLTEGKSKKTAYDQAIFEANSLWKAQVEKKGMIEKKTNEKGIVLPNLVLKTKSSVDGKGKQEEINILPMLAKSYADAKKYFSQPKTLVNLSVNYQSRPEFSRIISTVSYGFKFYNKKGLLTYDIVPLETYVVKAKLFGNFQSDLLKLNDFFLLNSFLDHVTTLSKVSAIYNNQGMRNRRNFIYLRTSVSSSGNILRGLYSIANQPKDDFDRYLIQDIPFSQFVKLDLDYRFYVNIRKLSKLVYRFAGGFGKPLKNLTSLPYEQSFFGGGPNTNRAWRARTLGPGSYAQPDSVSSRFDKIGDIQIESNIEYRFHIFKSFYGAWFVDAGNIWLSYNDPNKPRGQFKIDEFYKEFAIGSGFGLRYDFSFFVLRLDAALRVHDPQFVEGKRWVIGKQTLRESAILNFGIGYPF